MAVFSLTAAAAALALATNITAPNTENEFIKSLKNKFSVFYKQAPQDRLYVQTDKSFYKPGETVWFTAYVRDEQTLKSSQKSDIIHIDLITPKGTTERTYKLIAKNGVAQGDFDLTAHPGGLYRIKAYTEWQKNDEAGYQFEKEITVQSVVMPRLKMKLDFEKKAYGKGDEVTAKLELNTNANKPLSNTTVKFKASINGNSLVENKAQTDADGKVSLKFSLPKNLNSVDGLVNAMIDFEGSTESVSRSIPIVLNKTKLEFFPEGGDMVSNVAGKVAFRATNEFDKPADVEGIIVDSKGAFVSKFSSYHFGLGEFELTPKADEKYKARITKPEGILDEFELPEPLSVGYALQLNNSNDNLRISVYSWQNEELSLVAQTRGKISYTYALSAVKGTSSFGIDAKQFPIGVTSLTLFDSRGIARCERLVFLNKDKQLKVSVSSDKQQYQPREKVTMHIRVTDEKGLPVPGNFSLSVVDDNLLSFADDKQGNILSKMLLEPELKEKVEEPNFYFDTKEAKADKALDLLMLTSGWRRYSWKQVLSGDLPVAKFAGEKAEFSGYIMDGYGNKPLAGAVIKFNKSGLKGITDWTGKFTIDKVDLSKENQFEISMPGYQSQQQVLYSYGLNNNYYLYSNNYTYHWRKEMIPMAARPAPNAGAAEVMDVTVVSASKAKAVNKEKHVLAAEQKDFAAQNQFALAQDLAEKPDLEDLKKNVADDVAAENWAKEEVNDNRNAELVAFDKRIALQAPVLYYRAKEFPRKKYEKNDTTRNDFATTVFWDGNIETDGSGRAKVEFETNDLISSFKATIEGFGDDGAVGRTEYNFSTGLPFSMQAKLPTEMISGDKMQVPVFLKNTTTDEVRGNMVIVAPQQIQMASASNSEVVIPANSTKVIYLECLATNQIGDGNLEVKFTSPKFNDHVVQHLTVSAKGFPVHISLSGQDMEKEFAIKPDNVVPGSMKVTFNAYPNIMGELMSGVESILREPNGCFEQTSSSNYPNIMALQYLKTMQVNDPKLEARAKALLDQGYKKLVGFETKENGYEWFGAAPAHEALTAYGLMEFEDMKKVYGGVDPAMIERTKNLLIGKRDGKGGFKRNARAIDSFGGADEDITNAYIVYALTEAGYKDIKPEMDAVYSSAKKTSDPYIMALCANALFNLGDKTRGQEVVNQLINARGEVGFWTGKKHSITRSTGDGLKVETTSLILLALMKSETPDIGAITSAVKFLVGARSGYGGFGSTQATILALKSLTRYAEFSKKADESGTVEVFVNGAEVASKDYAKGERNNIAIDGLEKYVMQGKQKIEVRFKGCKQALPYSMNISYSTTLPQSDKECVVALETKLSATEAKVGETVRLSATLSNKTTEGQPMTMAIIGIPAGFSAQPWQLKEMQEKGVFDFYEIIGNNIASYYRSLAPQAIKQLNFDLKAEIPGEYVASASSAYLYYTSEHKDWKGLTAIKIHSM